MPIESAVGVVDQTAAGVGNTKAVDTTTITTLAGATQYRQTLVIGDPQSPLGLADVDPNEGLSVSLADPRMLVLLTAILARLDAIALQLGAPVSPGSPLDTSAQSSVLQ
jgi:hypothetical protein